VSTTGGIDLIIISY